LINIGGLTLGLSCFMLIINFVQHELSYDDFHENSESLYRVNMVSKSSGNKAAAIGPPMGPTMQAEFPEVESFVRLRHANDVLVTYEDVAFFEKKVFYVDSSFFNLFNFALEKGDAQTALSAINTAVISKEIAIKYFGDESAIGKVIKLENDRDLTITGVVSNANPPSHFKFDILVSFTTFVVPDGYPVTMDSWSWVSFPTYVRLKPNTDFRTVNDKFDDFILQHMGVSGSERLTLELQPLSEAYLYSKDVIERNGIDTKGDINYVIILLAIAFLILVIATFNFANLATSLSLRRVREIGVRKALGAERKMVFLQYCTEAIALVVISFLLALACLEVFSSSLIELFNAPFSLLDNLQTNWSYYLLVIVLIGLSGGLYPAVRLSGFSPVKALKNKVNLGGKQVNIKTILIGVQFAISILLVVGSIVINDQMNFLSTRDLGYDKENVIGLRIDSDNLNERYVTAKQQLLARPYVKSITVSDDFFDGQNGSVPVQERNNEESSFRISLFSGHYDFTETLGIEVLEGRDFSERFANDSTGFLLNESAVKMFGWKDSPIGKNIVLNGVWEGEVIGVVKDFNFASLHQEISPLIISMPRTGSDNIYIKLEAGDLTATMKQLEADWNAMHPDLPFDYTFLDSHVGNMYRSDQQFSALVFAFSGLAIFLACIGLYGMVAYSIDTKQKEIGVRKVLGASVSQVVFLLSRQFVVLVVLASVIAFPVSWMLLQDWLGEFAYRVDLSIVHLLIAFVGTSLVVGLTLSVKTIRAAQSNPVDTLKEE
jgi:putative ABC transport system permease protein